MLDGTDHESTLIGLTDPFSPEATNARYPDSGAGRTLTFTQKYAVQMSTDVNGNTADVFRPTNNYNVLVKSSIAGTVVTWPAAFIITNTGLLNTYGIKYRPTSMGLRVVNTLSATDSSGYLVLAKGGPPPLTGTTTFDPANFTSYDILPLVHGGEWHMTCNPKSANAYDFTDLSTSGTSGNDLATWESLYVGLFGSKASASPLFVEVYINYEYVPVEDAPIAQMAAPQPVLNVQMQTAVNSVQANHPNHHVGPRSVVKNFIKKEARKALTKHVLPFVAKKGAALLI